ncbi:MAG: hypothetical protein HGA78_08080 [Nitrospirales bacterium]|nr:hypothetical protein [Nitrospirales bacterium]
MRKRNRTVSFLKPFFVVSMLFLVFSIVWLRSSIISLEYSISRLESKKEELLRDRKLFMAKKANLLSVDKFEAASASGFVFPDRVKVVYVKRADEGGTYKASFRR